MNQFCHSHRHTTKITLNERSKQKLKRNFNQKHKNKTKLKRNLNVHNKLLELLCPRYLCGCSSKLETNLLDTDCSLRITVQSSWKKKYNQTFTFTQSKHSYAFKANFSDQTFKIMWATMKQNFFRIFAVPPQSSIQLLSFWSLWKGAPHQSDWNFASIETKTMISCILEATFFDARTETDKSVVSRKHLQLNHWRMLKRRMI